MNAKIFITDLANPQLTDVQRDALAFTDAMEIRIAVDSILADARRKTGLADFGRADFLRRLRLLCDEWEADDGITNFGKLSLCSKLVLFARNRLLIEDLLKKHPEIHNTRIEKPIIVCGPPYSGTTDLLNLLAADTQLRTLPLWESCEPLSLPGEPRCADFHDDPRYKRCQKQCDLTQQMTPLLAAMRPMGPDHIHEELELMGADFASYNFEWLSHSPRWRDDYYQHDQTPHYQYMLGVLKILQWQDKRHEKQKPRWVLKCSQHLEQIPALLNIFPDATIIVTHRDPVSVIQSIITMLAYSQRINRKKVQTRELADYWCDRIEHLLRAFVCDRQKIPADTSIEVPFDELMVDDMTIVRRIYQKAGLLMTEELEGQLRAFIHKHPRDKHEQVVYNLQGDFGVDPAELRKRFQFYFDALPVRIEI